MNALLREFYALFWNFDLMKDQSPDFFKFLKALRIIEFLLWSTEENGKYIQN